MSLKEVLGLGEDRKVRYGFVALGDIAQEAMMPGVEHTGNSVMTALVTNARKKQVRSGRSTTWRTHTPTSNSRRCLPQARWMRFTWRSFAALRMTPYWGAQDDPCWGA